MAPCPRLAWGPRPGEVLTSARASLGSPAAATAALPPLGQPSNFGLSRPLPLVFQRHTLSSAALRVLGPTLGGDAGSTYLPASLASPSSRPSFFSQVLPESHPLVLGRVALFPQSATTPQRSSRRFQEVLKTVPRGPKDGPRGFQDAQDGLQDGQDGSKRAQDGSQISPRRPKMHPRLPKMAQDRPTHPQEAAKPSQESPKRPRKRAPRCQNH